MPQHRRSFAGLDFEFDFYLDSIMQEQNSVMTMRSNFLEADYISALVASTYDRPRAKQAVLDALSPFQMMSKSWMSGLVAHAIRVMVTKEEYAWKGQYPDFHMRYHGSWFGQSAVLDYAHVDGPQIASTTLIDLDQAAQDIAWQVLDKLALADKIVQINNDALLIPFKHQDHNVVIWNGVEHFPAGSVQKFMADAPSGTLFCLQGTDMPAPDHINPVSEISQLYDPEAEIKGDHLLYFAGKMSCSFANRLAVAVLKR